MQQRISIRLDFPKGFESLRKVRDFGLEYLSAPVFCKLVQRKRKPLQIVPCGIEQEEHVFRILHGILVVREPSHSPPDEIEDRVVRHRDSFIQQGYLSSRSIPLMACDG